LEIHDDLHPRSFLWLSLELFAIPSESRLDQCALDLDNWTVQLAITLPSAVRPVCGSDAGRVRSRNNRRLASRKGQRHGAIAVGLERGDIIVLSPDRNAETVKKWLDEHPCRTREPRPLVGLHSDGRRSGTTNVG
jgi:hypothetical protein